MMKGHTKYQTVIWAVVLGSGMALGACTNLDDVGVIRAASGTCQDCPGGGGGKSGGTNRNKIANVVSCGSSTVTSKNCETLFNLMNPSHADCGNWDTVPPRFANNNRTAFGLVRLTQGEFDQVVGIALYTGQGSGVNAELHPHAYWENNDEDDIETLMDNTSWTDDPSGFTPVALCETSGSTYWMNFDACTPDGSGGWDVKSVI
jgi:hypothetical protein